MSTIMNDPGCVTSAGNTGNPGCFVAMKAIKGMILVPAGTTYTITDLAAFKVTLLAAVLAAGSARIYPIGPFEETTDNSTAMSPIELGHGGSLPGKEGKYKFSSRMIIGGVCLQKNLRKFNDDRGKEVLLIDDDWKIWGTSPSAGVMQGLAMNYFYAQPFKLDNGKDDSQFWVDVALADPKQINDAYSFVQFDVNPLDIVKGNIDVVLTELASGSDFVTIGIKTACDQVDLFDLYAGELDAAGAWTVTKAGVAVTPATVAQDTALKGIKISLTTPTGAHVFNLVSATALGVLNIGGSPENGFESTGSISKTF